MSVRRVDPLEVRGLHPDELRPAGEVLARSHQEDPAFSAVLPDPRRRARALVRIFHLWIADAARNGVVYAALEAGRILGVSAWLPPGRFPLSPRRKLRGTPDALRILAAAPRDFTRLMRFQQNGERLHAEPDSWYLEIVGVDDGARGRGIGGRLLEPALARADRDGKRCSLETARAELVGWYERFGFVVTNPAVPLVPGGPTHWQMARAPRSV